MKIPFVGPSYEDVSVNFDAQRCINQMLVKSETGDSKSPAKLQQTPGLLNYTTVASTSRTRSAIESDGRAFFVVGNALVEAKLDGTNSVLGTLLTDHGFVGIASNDAGQLCMVDGPNGYIFLLTNTNNIFVDPTFGTAGDWTTGAGWSITGNTGTATGAISTVLSTTPTIIYAGASYTVKYTVTRSAGSVTVSVGGTAGTARSAAGTYTETIVAGTNGLLAFTGAGFTGTVSVASASILDSFVQITAAYFLGADTVSMVDGYFQFNEPNSQVWYLSALQDGTRGDPTQFASKEGASDHLAAVAAFHDQTWLLGLKTLEVWQDNGNILFPFSKVPGAFLEYGCAAAGSVAKTANSLLWLGQDKDGALTVWQVTNYQPIKVSNFGVDFALQQMTTPGDCTSYTYQESGKWYYVMNFTTDNQTWVLDIANSLWHERLAWNSSMGSYERHWSEQHIYCFGKHLVGDYQTGNIYSMSLNYYDDNGTQVRRERRSQHTADDLEYLYFGRFQLDMETGVGLATGAAEDINPTIELSWSDDGGHTWSKGASRSVGLIGEFSLRVFWRQLGRSRDRIWRTIYTARTKYNVFAAHVNMTGGMNP